MNHMEHDQARYPLATLVIEASKRAPAQRDRLETLAARVAAARGHSL